MEIIALLKSFIFLVSSSLLLPVLFALSLLLCWIAWSGGGLFREWIDRRRSGRAGVHELVASFSPDMGEARGLTPPVRRFQKALDEVLGALETADRTRQETVVLSLIEEFSLRLNTPLTALRVVIRTGPGLGLIGTLIPMGTGLAALGQGDMARLSSDLVVAFTTTVVGLFEGLAAYLFLAVRTRWIQEDLAAMEALAEARFSEGGGRGGDA